MKLMGNNESVRLLLKEMIENKIILKKNWKYFVILIFKEEYREKLICQKIKVYCEKLKEYF